MIDLEIDQLKNIPIEKWKRLLKERYNVIMLNKYLRGQDFSIGEEADNNFLEISCFCKGLNQTQAIIGEEDYRKYILEEKSYIKKKITVTLETEVEVYESDSNDDILKIAFPIIGFDENTTNQITCIEIA